MKPCTILSTIAFTGITLAAPAPEPATEAEAQIPLLRFNGVTDISSRPSYFTGVGIPGVCYALPTNVYGFTSADAAFGYSCYVYTGPSCSGSFLNVATPIPQPVRAGKGAVPISRYQSWKCTPGTQSPFPPHS